jgi:3-deoxy-manno-octulosonate cytidylyltransferase (CMP-KDO synthetase)
MPAHAPTKDKKDKAEALKRIAVIIPARMKATRLKDKPLAVIGDAPMIVHVMRRAFEAGFGKDGAPVIIACDDERIADAVAEHAGSGHEGIAVLTDPAHPSGSDRVHEALESIDPGGKIEIVINLQGDLPEIDANMLLPLAEVLLAHDADIATPVVRATADEIEKPQVVKAAIAFGDLPPEPGASAPVLYFSRHPIPHGGSGGGPGDGTGDVPVWHHVGIYAWRRAALARFVSLAPSPLEKTEKLEQLRALEAGMKIVALVVDTAPGGIDTPEDLAAARKRMA